MTWIEASTAIVEIDEAHEGGLLGLTFDQVETLDLIAGKAGRYEDPTRMEAAFLDGLVEKLPLSVRR